jgi:cystathionine beta-lyase
LGTPTTFALAETVNLLEQGAGSAVASSGLAACTQAILPFVSGGDHILVTDSVYGPTRKFCDQVLRRFGVETTYFDPCLGADLESLIRPRTRLIFTESPGSLTFEMQDIPAIADVARRHGCLVLIDNTWATPLFFKPLAMGADISIQAATKYMSGHSDLVLGVITSRTPELFLQVRRSLACLGDSASPDDCYLALRGMRSLAARMRVQQESALMLAKWLETRPEVLRVLYPPLESDPGHALWKRDCTGAGAVFGVLLTKMPDHRVADMIDRYRFFGVGASWGGFESLVLTSHPWRTVKPWDAGRHTLLRYSVGLEDPEDLLADLEEGFIRLANCFKR